MATEKIEVDDEIVERLKRRIIIKETQNLKNRNLSDDQMVKWIKKKIEEEVQCCLNQ